jgi:hypothetical protein
MDSIDSDNETKAIGIDPNDRNEAYGQPPANPIAESLQRIADFSERQREKFSPSIIEISPDAGLPTAARFVSHVRLRMIGFILTSVTAGTWTLAFGGRTFTFQCPANDTKYIIFPYEIDRGIDIQATRTVGGEATWDFYLIAYPE